ncbi:hypothetical protein EBR21_08030 [bacterium]|nr:hypothetical protein [bacterium]
MTAFNVVVFDGVDESPVALPVRVNVAAINDVPTFGVSDLLNNASKNQPNGYSISFADIMAKIPVNDVETPANQIEYRIESVGSGTLRLGPSQTGTDVASLTNKPFLRAAGGDGVTAASQLNWTPPLNAVGTFTVMTLRAFDGTDFTVQPIEVRINVVGSNAVPTINSGFTLGSSTVPAEGTYQNVPLVVSYETLAQKSGAADTDLTTVYLRITSLESGTLRVGNQLYTTTGALNPPLKIGPGDKITWSPVAEARGVDGAALSAFRIEAYDNVDASANKSLVKVNVTPVNQAPTIAGSYVFPDAVRNQEYEISFNTLAENLAIADVEDINPAEVLATSPNKYGKMKFKVESILGGQSLRIGANTGSASAWSAATGFVQPGEKIFWLPPANARGTFDGFMVSVLDLNGRVSSTMAKVTFVVDGPNVPPQLASVTKKYPDVGQNTPYIISYDTLKNDLGITDIDNANLSFVFTNINANAGKLVVSSTQRTAWPNVTFSAPPVSAKFSKGEQLVFIPNDNFNGNNIEIFRVRAWDGEAASGQEAVVSADIARVNQIPLMTRISPLTGGVQNTAFLFSYDDLRNKTDVFDVEEPLPVKTVGFKIKSINSGTLRRITSAVGATPVTYANLSASSVLNPGERFEWMPGLNANGTLNAMNLVAYDSDGAESQAQLVPTSYPGGGGLLRDL